MANTPPLPAYLTKNDIRKLLEACEKFYALELLGEGYRGYLVTKWAIPSLGYSWSSSRQFFKDASALTGQGNIKDVYSVLSSWEAKAPDVLVSEEKQEISETVPRNLKELEEALDRAKSEEQKTALTKNYRFLKTKGAPGGSTPKEVPTEEPVAETAPRAEEPPQAIGIQITPEAGKAFQKFTNRVASLPVRTAIAWAAPTVAAQQPGPAPAAMVLWSRGIKGTSLEEARPDLPTRASREFDGLIRAIKGLENDNPLQTRMFQASFPYEKISLFLKPETGVSQAQMALFLNPPAGGGSFAVPRRSFLGNILVGAGRQLFGKAASKAVSKFASKAGAKAIGAEFGAAVGGPAAPLTSLIGSWISDKVISKIPDIISWLQTHAKEFGAGAVALLAGGAFFGNPFLLAGGLGLGALSLGAGGVGSLATGAASFGQGVLSGITGIALPAIGVPILVSLLIIPVVITIILFIINSGAYLVPPRSELLTGGVVSPYIDVKKTASPDCLNRTEEGKSCGKLPGEVKYDVEIRAKKGTLTNIKIENVYTVFGKGSGKIESPSIEVPSSISPVGAFTFSYSVPFEKNLDNSVVYDTLTVTADAPGQAGAVASAVASVIVGNPPASSCPIVGGAISTGSYNGSREVGHGSNSYWSGPAGTDCGYEIPAFSGCGGPTASADADGNNVCRNAGGLCPYYGYAADVRRGGVGDVVQLPSIFGQTINWKFGRRVTIARGSWGYGYTFTGSAGGRSYSLYLGHLNKIDPPASLPSGTVLGTLYPGLTPPHVHIELQLNGQWVRPDFLCGGPGP